MIGQSIHPQAGNPMMSIRPSANKPLKMFVGEGRVIGDSYCKMKAAGKINNSDVVGQGSPGQKLRRFIQRAM